MATYESDVKIGEKYRDEQTGYEGVAVSIEFNQHGCERVVVESPFTGGEIKHYVFDAARLTSIETGETATQRGTGARVTSSSRHVR